MQKVLYISKRKWDPNIPHHLKADDLSTDYEIAEGYRIGHVAEANFQDAVEQDDLF